MMSGSSSSSSSSSRFSVQDFAYNGRVAVALLPSLGVCAALGGQAVFMVLALGAIAGFSMDLMQYRDGAFSMAWLTMLATSCAFSISLLATSSASLALQIGLVLAVVLVTLLCGMWASLQFKYFQMHRPAVTLAFEHFVITSSLPAAAIMHTIGLSLFVDATDIPYYTATLLCVLYVWLGLPLQSSFVATRSAAAMGGGSTAAGGTTTARKAAKLAALARGPAVQTRLDGALMALLTCCVPSLLYATIHWEVLFNHVLHLYSLLLLGSVPAVVLALIPGGFWWLPGSPKTQRVLQGVVLTMALVAAVIGFEGRVVFHSFGQYVKLPPPWNWLAVTAALMGMAAITLAAQQGSLGGTLDVTVAGCALLLCTTAGALATGVPFYWLPAPLVAACGLALFFDSRSLREYIVFVGGAFMTGVWFVLQHFWLLDIHVGGLHLHTLCKMALAALLPALMIPGLVQAHAPAPALDAMLMLQTMLLTVLEEALYVPSHSDWSGEPMYPAWLVIATSALGLIATRHLATRHHVTALGAWVGHAVYSAKLVMLLLPEAALVLPTVLLVLTATAPLFLSPSAQGPAPNARGRRVRIPPWLGLLQALSTLLALALARFAVFDVVQFLLSSRPTEGLLLGALLLTGAACLAPLVITNYSTNQFVRRVLACLVLGGMMLVVLQPPLPLRGGAACPKLPLALCPRLWDERHLPLHDTEDAEIWGTGQERKEHWPRWLLFAALMLGVGAGAVGGGAIPAAMARRTGGARRSHDGLSADAWLTTLKSLAVAAITGFLVGGYVALEVVPNQMVLQVLVLISCLLVVAFVCLLPLPSVRGPMVLPSVALLWFVVLALTLLLQAELPPPEAPLEMRRLFPDSHLQVEEEIEAATRAALLAVAACQAAVLALALKLHVVSTLQSQDAHLASENGHGGESATLGAPHLGFGAGSSAMFCNVVPLASFSRWGKALRLDGGACGALLHRLGGVGLGWAPTLGNLCACSAYVMCVSLNVQVTGGSPEALFMAAPLLLLLQQDPLIAPGLTAARRYVVPFFATATSLLLSCTTASFNTVQLSGTGLGIVHTSSNAHKALLPLLQSGSPMTQAFMEVGLAALTLPAIATLSWAMWISKPLALFTQIWTGGLCVLVLLLSAQPAALYLTGMVLVSSLVHHAGVRHTRRISAKII